MVYSASRVNVTIAPSILVAYIEGGNRISGYGLDLNLKGLGRDPDVMD